MDYGRPGQSRPVDRGQLLELEGLVNDEKLVRLGYVSSASKGIAIVQCGKCGAKFVTDEALASHGRERHPNVRRSVSPDDEERQIEKKLAVEDSVAPLYLEKTTATWKDSTAGADITTKKRASKKRNTRAAAKGSVHNHTGR